MHTNQVFEVVKLPADRTPVGCRFVFKVKRKADGTVQRYRARLVAKGYSQTPGVDYDETFASVVKMESLRVLLAIAAAQKYSVRQVDIKTAFLHGDLDEEVYMQLPPTVSSDEHGDVWLLRKSIYGLKQAPRQWYAKLHQQLISMGFKRLQADNSVYITHTARGERLFIAVYVDDCVIIGNERDTEECVKKLGEKFPLTDYGEIEWLLGISVKKAGDKFQLTQKQYIHKLLERFGMQDCKPVATPLEAGAKLTKEVTEEEKKQMHNVPYREAVGSLVYLMMTRPDICQAVGAVSQYVSSPGLKHWEAVKRIMRYLKKTADAALIIGGDDLQLSAYSDSDWAGDPDTRRSTSGYVFCLGTSTVSWNSRKQPTVALSSTEAEYLALTAAGKQAVWLQLLLSELEVPQKYPTLLYCDNQGAIALVRNPVHHSRTKHIEVRHHKIREWVDTGAINVRYCPTEEMLADMFTKAISREKLEKAARALNLITIIASGSVEEV